MRSRSATAPAAASTSRLTRAWRSAKSCAACELAGEDFDQKTASTEERLGQDRAYVISSERARRELGWTPRVSLDEGLAEVGKWIDANWEEIASLPHEYVHKR